VGNSLNCQALLHTKSGYIKNNMGRRTGERKNEGKASRSHETGKKNCNIREKNRGPAED
jgi:hypothetical protein